MKAIFIFVVLFLLKVSAPFKISKLKTLHDVMSVNFATSELQLMFFTPFESVCLAKCEINLGASAQKVIKFDKLMQKCECYQTSELFAFNHTANSTSVVYYYDENLKPSKTVKLNRTCDLSVEYGKVQDGEIFCIPKNYITAYEQSSNCSCLCGNPGTIGFTRQCVYFEMVDPVTFLKKTTTQNENNPCGNATLYKTIPCYKNPCHISIVSHLTGTAELADSDSSFSYSVKTISGGHCDLGAIDEPGSDDREAGEFHSYIQPLYCDKCMLSRTEPFETVTITAEPSAGEWQVVYVEITRSFNKVRYYAAPNQGAVWLEDGGVAVFLPEDTPS